jgi:predicted nucleic acid-binding protein
MKYVLDASVAVAALRSNEPGHHRALRRCTALFAGEDEVVVPVLFDVEVTAALVRRGADPARVAAFFRKHFASRTVVTLGPRAARATQAIVNSTQLRASDAFYVWVAAREGLPLVTANAEILRRAGGVCQVEMP